MTEKKEGKWLSARMDGKKNEGSVWQASCSDGDLLKQHYIVLGWPPSGRWSGTGNAMFWYGRCDWLTSSESTNDPELVAEIAVKTRRAWQYTGFGCQEIAFRLTIHSVLKPKKLYCCFSLTLLIEYTLPRPPNNNLQNCPFKKAKANNFRWIATITCW